MDKKVNVKSISALLGLRDVLKSTGKSLKDISEKVDLYNDTVLKSLDESVEYFYRKLHEAKDILRRNQDDLYKAEAAYNRCITSQREKKDEAGNIYMSPSCAMEANRKHYYEACVKRAEEQMDKCQKKFDKAKTIYDAVKREIDLYNQPTGFFQPCGGRYLLLYLADNRTDSAVQGIERVVDSLQNILRTPLSSGGDTLISYNAESIDNGIDIKRYDIDDSDGCKQVDESIERIYGETAVPDVFEICEECGRPRILCPGHGKDK